MSKILLDTNIFDFELFQKDGKTSFGWLEKILHRCDFQIYFLDLAWEKIDFYCAELKTLRPLLNASKFILSSSEIECKIKDFPVLKKIKKNEDLDSLLLGALLVDAELILVTNRNELCFNAELVGLDDRIYQLEDIVGLLEDESNSLLNIETFYPQVRLEKCRNLNVNEPFFDSLRHDYKNFNKWFEKKCVLGNRNCFVIRNEIEIIGLCIYKEEAPLYEMMGKIIKICTFKLNSSGTKQGELLLRHVLKMSYDLNVDWLYVTAFESNSICFFLENFGFKKYKKRKSDTGELIYRRKIKPSEFDECNLSAVQFHKEFGYRYFKRSEPAFLVPIQKKIFNLFFPETENSGFDLFESKKNASIAIRKAYVCNCQIKKIKPGNILFFYRSHSDKTLRCCGIVEQVYQSSNPDEILPLIGKRSLSIKRKRLEMMCSDHRKCLLILFRQTENLKIPCDVKKLKESNLIRGYPKNITEISEEAKECILKHMPC